MAADPACENVLLRDPQFCLLNENENNTCDTLNMLTPFKMETFGNDMCENLLPNNTAFQVIY